MDALLLDWLSLLLRWLHVITAIAWIGASFYFIWLDNSLETPPDWKKANGVSGDLWAFHGGGIYEVAKYALAPPEMPKTLHWFKWEAYSTWITGSLLLIAVYYFRAELYLVGPDNLLSEPAAVIAASLGFLLSGLIVYEVLVRTLAPVNMPLFLSLLCGFLAFCCWLAPQLFSDRAAFIHVGALMATIMAANVFLGIMPAQRGFMRAIAAGHTPDKTAMLAAKTRSVHNNYFTLPVLFCMISNHYSFLYGHDYNWLVLIAIIAITAYARHFFNLRHRGIIKPQILILATLATLAVGAAMQVYQQQKSAARAASLAVPQAQATIAADAFAPESLESRLLTTSQTHCQGCHASQPSTPGFSAPPAGILLETLDQIRVSRDKIIPAVATGYMPLGNMTAMSDEERQRFLQAVNALAP